MKIKFLFSFFISVLLIASCTKEKEYSESEANDLRASSKNALLSKTVQKFGGQKYEIGKVGGTWVSSISSDPKTFNCLIVKDSMTSSIIGTLTDYLADYDPYKKEWKANLASFEIKIDEKKDRLDVIYKLRDDLYWTTPADSQKIKVTSDDVIFWYNEIDGDKRLQQSSYPQQFVSMKDGKTSHIDIEKIDDLSFVFHYPRIISNPILSTNMEFGPRYIYEKTKKQGGVEALLKLFSIDTDVKKIPSIGQYYIYEYHPGVQVVLKRNPNYWKKDENGTSLPYIETYIVKIVPDKNTELLLFKEGKLDSYSLRSEDLDSLTKIEKPDFTIYNGGATLSSDFISFNQNPKTMDKKVYNWFKETKFRQAMSCMINRKRIIEQVYRGLAEPALYLFAKPNPFFDEKIKEKFTYDPDHAVRLLSEIGIKKNKDSLMADKDGNHIEFEITVAAQNDLRVDIANIISDELKNIGITAKVKPIDLQKVLEMLTNTYDWHSIIIGLGVNYWPSQGSNVWPSKGDLHLWHPLQDKPANEWESRIDYLYNEGQFTIDKAKAKKIYDEYQHLILDQNPLVYFAYPDAFSAVRNKWGNIFFDTLGGTDMNYVYLKDQ
jgi:peptide/nickel transport system substrate-binding protein